MTAPGRGAAALLLAAALAMAWLGAGETAGVARFDLSAAFALLAAALWLNAWAAERGAEGRASLPGALAMWAVFVATSVAVFAHRQAVYEQAITWTDEIGLTRPDAVVSGTGELTVMRRVDGTFLVPAQINGRESRMIFDTGATAVVLTSETARAIGIRAESLNFRVPVSTANGRALAAPVLLDSLAVGPIAVPRMPALVAAPGMLHENLLGQTFMDRLGSYEVRGRRLVLRAGNG